VLKARQEAKSELGVDMTMIRPAENNPLKFSANVDDALHNLFVKRSGAYLGPVEAFEDAFGDLRYHQLAMWAALQAAFDNMLAEFAPDRLQKEFDDQLKKGALISKPASWRYWELYRAKFHDMVRDAEKCYSELFGDEFARAYEEQLKRLKSQGRAPKR
jgi:type VI secretion system FHA domain protein